MNCFAAAISDSMSNAPKAPKHSPFWARRMIAAHENSVLAKQLFAEAIERYGIEPGRLIVHQDRGAPMTSHGFADLLDLLGVERSYSRPRVSNDNPWSESLFHTGRYQPDYPGRFRDSEHARSYFSDFFSWYNDVHCHDGIALFTLADVYFGRVDAVLATRQAAADRILSARPEDLSALWPTNPPASTTPVINLPGRRPRSSGGEPAQPLTT